MSKAIVKSVVLSADEENCLDKGYSTVQIEGITVKGVSEIRIGNSIDGGTLKLLLEALGHDVEYIEIIPDTKIR